MCAALAEAAGAAQPGAGGAGRRPEEDVSDGRAEGRKEKGIFFVWG